MLCRFSATLAFLVYPFIVLGQTVIREKVTINPKPPSIKATPTTSSSAPDLSLLEFGTTGYNDFVRTTVPGVTVNGVLTVTPSELPEQSAVEVSAAGKKIYKVVNGCGGTDGEPENPFPIHFSSCGTVGMAGNTWSPYYAICLPLRSAAQGRAEVTGPTTAKLTVNMPVYVAWWSINYQAVLELTASLDPLYQPSQVKVTPVATELVDAGSTTINVEVRSGAGNLVTNCSGASPIMATASLEAKGPYAYLQAGTQTGSSLMFPLSGGKASISLVLDPANGVIPECEEEASMTVSVGGISGTATVDLKCTYPKPTLEIIHPLNDTTITVTADNQPILGLQEKHTPEPGEKFEPTIGWEPSNLIDTKDYFEQIQDSLILTVNATATNAVSTSSDSRRITLKKASHPPVIDSVRTAEGDTLFAVGSTVTLEGYYQDEDDDVITEKWEGPGIEPLPITTSAHSVNIAQVGSVSSSDGSSKQKKKTARAMVFQPGRYTYIFTVTDRDNTATKNLNLEFKGPELIVTVASPDQTIDEIPKMPSSEFVGQLKYFNDGTVNFFWDLTVEWTGPNGRKTKGVYTGQGNGANSNPLTLPFNFDTPIRGGDRVTLHVVAVGGVSSTRQNLRIPLRLSDLIPPNKK